MAVHLSGAAEVIETVALPICMFAAARIVATIIPPTVTVIDVAAPTRFAVVPRPGANEYSIGEPFRAVVPVRSASIRRVVIVTIGTYRLRSDSNGNAYPGIGLGSSYRQANHNSGSY